MTCGVGLTCKSPLVSKGDMLNVGQQVQRRQMRGTNLHSPIPHARRASALSISPFLTVGLVHLARGPHVGNPARKQGDMPNVGQQVQRRQIRNARNETQLSDTSPAPRDSTLSISPSLTVGLVHRAGSAFICCRHVLGETRPGAKLSLRLCRRILPLRAGHNSKSPAAR